ncbi:MAG: hypothetical protein JSU74_06990, partial [Candidatus Zixiibacteriota bacterium]
PVASRIFGALTLALAAPIAVWSIGGLEQPLAACLLAWAIVMCLRITSDPQAPAKSIWIASACLGLLAITRPDGIMFTAALVVAISAVKGINIETLRLSLKLISFPVVFFLGQLVFRLIYYGEWVANVALVKISPSWHHAGTGAEYLGGGLLSLSPLSEVALLFVLFMVLLPSHFDKASRQRILFLTIPALLWSGYLVFIGGDYFPAWRHFTLLLPIMALVIVEASAWLLNYTTGLARTVIFYLFWILCFVGLVLVQFSDSRNRVAAEEMWEWDGEVVGMMLKKGFGKYQPLLAVEAAGCIPYWSDLPSLDMVGLNDYYLPRHPPEDFGQAWIGHELGEGDYVLGREPDLIIFGSPRGSAGALLRSGLEMQGTQEFFDQYTMTTFEAKTPRACQSQIWVRRFSARIGIEVTDSSITIPAYLINGGPKTTAYLNEAGDFLVSITGDRWGGVGNLQLPAGDWSLRVNPAEAVKVTVRFRESGDLLLDDITPCTLTLADSSIVDVTLIPARKPRVEIQQFVFMRLPQT